MHIVLFVCTLEILLTNKLDILLKSSLQNQLALYLGFQVKGVLFVSNAKFQFVALQGSRLLVFSKQVKLYCQSELLGCEVLNRLCLGWLEFKFIDLIL